MVETIETTIADYNELMRDSYILSVIEEIDPIIVNEAVRLIEQGHT